MAAHRYWRLLVDRNFANGRIQIAEIEFRGSIGGATLTSGGTPLVSGTSLGAAANLYDSSNATQWNSAISADAHWAGYDFGAPVEVVEVRARSGSDGAFLSDGNTLLQYSDNNVRWVAMGPAFRLAAVNTEYVVSGFAEIGARVVAPAPSLQSFPPTWPATARTTVPPVMLLRAFIGGDGRIVGTVTIKGTPNVPVRRRVRLYREVDGVCVGEQWSDATTGAYAFVGFDRTLTYTVLAYDGPRVFKATLADGVIPELIP